MMHSYDLALMPVMLPLAASMLGLLAKAWNNKRWSLTLEWIAGIVGLFIPLLLLFLLLPALKHGPLSFYVGNRAAAVGILQRFDGLSWLVDILGFTGASAAWLYSRGSGPKGPLFTTLFLIQTAALAATASCADLFNLFVCLEVLGIASYALTASSEKPAAFLAAFSYLAISTAAMGVFLLGVYGFYRLSGTLSYDGIAAALPDLDARESVIAGLSLVCIVAATAVRVAVLPVYGWLPDAHASAPHPVSAVLSGVLIKTPLFALGRFMMDIAGTDSIAGSHVQDLFGILGVSGTMTALIAVLLALSQKDAKRLLAYHSISQIGYVVSAWALASPLALAAAWLHAFSHSLFKGLLFLSVGAAVDAAGTRDVYLLRNARASLRQAGDRYNLVFLSFAVAALSIAAIPPFNGYASKSAVLALYYGRWQYWILNLAALGTLASMIKLSRIFFSPFGSKKRAPAIVRYNSSYTLKPSTLLSLVILAVFCLLGGLFARDLGAFTADLLGSAHNPVKAALFLPETLIKSAPMILAGIILFMAAISPVGKALTRRIHERQKSFSGLVLAFSAAVFILGLSILR